ncbi:uncharacterized protein F5891DRAFT_1184962 [Suillus fuscotomentosus]|uniref:Uncharacterized protein n=1 Tax=Suillus fuscotomentosus TaxID=1912939 RepID=A0AAD4EFI5_9AGAM|nr:uncharacterized protein F5891DRAFT_1184962 [Suillus fuscotomentosus]KAG1904008.1 hypothetical protein F5891DRAFT_1184962 [Suillus fuscotomentosus]
MDVGPVWMSLNQSEPIIHIVQKMLTVNTLQGIKGWGASKDTSEIQWYHDADDDMPISPHPESSSKALSSGPSHHTLDSFIGQMGIPATCAIPAKHSGTTTMPPATKHPLVPATSSSTIGDNDGDGDDDNDIPTNKDESDDEEAKEAGAAYQQIKAFGDAD